MSVSRISDLCRLCLANCRSMGILVFPSNDIRRDKIRDCLSIIIQDDARFPLIICNECDNKLNSFYQFRLGSVRAQQEFADIIKSFHPIHYENNVEYYPHDVGEHEMYRECIVNVENIYSSTPAPTTSLHSTHGYDNQSCYIEHDLDLDTQSLVSMATTTDNIYATVHPPHISPLSPAMTPVLEQQPQLTPRINENPICYSENAVGYDTTMGQYSETKIEPFSSQADEPKIEHFIEKSEYEQPVAEQFVEEDDFTYDDFDDNTCQSVPSDRNNVDNAIDQKIEEFIQNKGGKKTNPKICTICNKLFRTNYKLRVHYETHAENNAKYICDFESCNKAFKSKIGLREHAAKHTGTFNFTCETCQKQFLLKSYFAAHKRIHEKERPRNFACSLCPKTFKSKQNLIDHENCHFGIKYFKCETCDRSFTTKTHLDHHVKSSHNQSEQFLCSICNKFLKSKNYLKIHLKTHFPELKNYTCGYTYCGKKFIQMSDLKIHSLIHTKEKSFVCESCGKSFSRKDSLQLHMQTHRKDKRYSCRCGKTYSRQTSLNSHKKRCVNEIPTSAS